MSSITKVRIFADSISDIPQEWIEKYNINLIPLYIAFDERTYLDRIEMDRFQVYKKIEMTGKFPEIAVPEPSVFINAFSPIIQNGEDVLFISMSSELSSMYQNSLIAAREFPAGRVTVVDSKNISAGTAMNVFIAVQAAEQGKSALYISGLLRRKRDEIQFNVLVDGYENRLKRGRVNIIKQLLGSKLRIQPILYVSHGRILSGVKYRGNKQKVLRKLLDSILSQIHRIEQDQIIIAQNKEEETAEWIQRKIYEETNIRDVFIIEGGCAICSHSGTHSLGISFVLKS
ncbi:DegV family protein [Paenibacillus illinoisensis]|uniref:DegV family protein n=1 Tax=Paenibacillus illinoisensis TaxID=59845 RepID=UPI0030184C3C